MALPTVALVSGSRTRAQPPSGSAWAWVGNSAPYGVPIGMHVIPCQLPCKIYIIWRKMSIKQLSDRFNMDANWFQQAFDRAGVTQADLARHLRLAPSAVSRMLKGERQMKLLEAVQVSAFLGVPQDEVLSHAGASLDAPPGIAAGPAGPARRGRPPRVGPAPIAP